MIWTGNLRHPRKDKTALSLKPGEGERSWAATANVSEKQALTNIITEPSLDLNQQTTLPIHMRSNKMNPFGP